MRFFILGLTLAYSSNALGQETNTEEPRVIYKERTEIDFEALELEGQLIKPDGALLLERKKASFNPLIRLRTNFDVEMSESVNEIK